MHGRVAIVACNFVNDIATNARVCCTSDSAWLPIFNVLKDSGRGIAVMIVVLRHTLLVVVVASRSNSVQGFPTVHDLLVERNNVTKGRHHATSLGRYALAVYLDASGSNQGIGLSS